MGSPLKPLWMVGVFGVVGILGVLGPAKIAESWFWPPAQRRVIAITNERYSSVDRQNSSDLEYGSPSTGSSLTLEEGISGTGKPTTQTEEIERLKASLEELGQLLQTKSALESEVARLNRLEEMTKAMSNVGNTQTREMEKKIMTQAEEIKRLQAELEKQYRLLQEQAAELSSVGHAEKRQNAEKEEKIALLESEVAHLNHILEGRTTALSTAEEAATKREQLIHDLSSTNQQLREEIRQMKRRTSTDSDLLGSPLSPTIINKADSISVAEVAESVKVLNAQIEQTSSLIMDSFFDKESTSAPGDELEHVLDELNDYIGPWLCNNLRRRWKDRTVERNPLITQITLQAGLVNACSRIINDWNPPFWIDGLILSRTYNNIEKAKGQATADAWRKLSRTHMAVSQSERQEANKTYLTEVLLKLMIAVGGSLESAGILLSQYKEKVDEIIQKSVGIHKTINEEVTSMELVTYTYPSDTPFDASHMEDTGGDESETRTGDVFCTVEMGLRYKKREGFLKKNEWGVTMKSKVVLSTMVEA